MMKKSLFVFIVALFFLQIPFAQAFGDWTIPTYDVVIEIQKQGTLRVTEEIWADFTREPSHGIFRVIPYRGRTSSGGRTSKTSKVVKTPIKLISVVDEQGNSWPVKKSREGDSVVWKIGFPDQLQNSKRLFRIVYEVKRAILFFDDHDELYWNVNGTEWETDIGKLIAIVKPPEKIKEPIRLTCYTGPYGSTDQNCMHESSPSEIFFATTVPLQSRENMTIVVGLPKGYIEEPSKFQKYVSLLTDNYGFLIPLPFFIWLFVLWYRGGRDPKSRLPIVPHYEAPDDLTPSEVGTIYDAKVDERDITADLINLARRGYIHIKEIIKKDEKEPENYEFIRKKVFKNDASLAEHEKYLLDAVLGEKESKKMSEIKSYFYKKYEKLEEKLYDEVVKKGYFPHNPENIRAPYLGFGILGIVLAPILYFFSEMALHLPTGIGIIGILLVFFGTIMPKRTEKGVETLQKIKGLKMYIETAEKEKIRFHEKEGIFMKLLPYAMVFKLADQWSEAFEGISMEPPDWYEGAYTFSPARFVLRMAILNSLTANTIGWRPDGKGGRGGKGDSSAWGGGSGFGGGFSGGGFGGGGGGRW